VFGRRVLRAGPPHLALAHPPTVPPGTLSGRPGFWNGAFARGFAGWFAGPAAEIPHGSPINVEGPPVFPPAAPLRHRPYGAPPGLPWSVVTPLKEAHGGSGAATSPRRPRIPGQPRTYLHTCETPLGRPALEKGKKPSCHPGTGSFPHPMEAAWRQSLSSNRTDAFRCLSYFPPPSYRRAVPPHYPEPLRVSMWTTSHHAEGHSVRCPYVVRSKR
jgi:hypothetical protein